MGRAWCDHCENDYQTTASGMIRKHGDCPGGGLLPRQDPTVHSDVATTGDTSWVPPEPAAAAVPQTAADALLMGNTPARAAGSADDFLMGQDPPTDGSDVLVTGGRYNLPDQLTQAPRRWTRATTFAETLSDLYAINLYKLQMATIGFANNPYLLEEFEGVTREERGVYRDRLNTAHWKAARLAGDKVPANWGTEMHNWIERLSRDEITLDDVHPNYRDEVAAWAAAMAEADLSAVPGLIERRVAVPLYNVAGTLDQVDRVHRGRTVRINEKIFRLNAGEHVIGDVKSGRDLSYAENEISQQMAIYAHGIREGKVAKWDQEANEGEGAWTWEKIDIDPKSVRQDVGVVMHVPIGQKKCTLHWIDLQKGWDALQLAEAVRDWRRTKGLMSPFSVAEVPTKAATPVVRATRWTERFEAVTSKDAGRKLFAEYRRSPEYNETAAKSLVAIAKASIASITEESA